jgi:hypothetical protein
MQGDAGENGRDFRTICCLVGMSQPISRAFVAASVTGVAAYAYKSPYFFDEDGALRPWKPVSKSPSATHMHFLTVPVTAGIVAYLLL